MKKWSIWILAIVLVLGIGFSALAEVEVLGSHGPGHGGGHKPPQEETPPEPATCKGNLVRPLARGMDVTLHVVPYAKLELNDMDISFCQPGTALNGQTWVPFSGGANTKIDVDIKSEGFRPSLANQWITYAVSGLGSGDQDLTPGSRRGLSFTRNPGKWNGRLKASGAWQDDARHDWTEYLAGNYTDTIVFTVSKAHGR